MLDKDALNQLQGLKDKIEAEKEYAEGTVKATRSRFGFVVLDDNREIFLPPDEMQRTARRSCFYCYQTSSHRRRVR